MAHNRLLDDSDAVIVDLDHIWVSMNAIFKVKRIRSTYKRYVSIFLRFRESNRDKGDRDFL